MKKNYLIYAFILFIIFGFKLNVNADSAQFPADLDYENFKAIYDAGPVRVTVSSSGTPVNVYGMSTCIKSTNTCTYKYYGLNSENVDTYFENYVTCDDGYSSVGYRLSDVTAGASQGLKGTYSDDPSKLVDEITNIYWFEEYKLYCINSSNENNGDYIIIDNNNNNSTNNNNSNNSTNNNNTNSNGGYVTSDPVDNPDSGVFTYYIVLGVIAFVSYILLIVAKKYNLFKKI